ncbi:hypothetical protein BJV77DRAFT_964060 [Russula vinacea]|nr:hypothetical protein BJV77DRAFT_964060 [Russula vinacea]
MSQSDPPPYSTQDVSQHVNVTVLIEKDGNPTVNLGNFFRPLRFDAIVERLIQLGLIKDTLSHRSHFQFLAASHHIVVVDGPSSQLPMDRGKSTCSRYCISMIMEIMSL